MQSCDESKSLYRDIISVFRLIQYVFEHRTSQSFFSIWNKNIGFNIIYVCDTNINVNSHSESHCMHRFILKTLNFRVDVSLKNLFLQGKRGKAGGRGTRGTRGLKVKYMERTQSLRESGIMSELAVHCICHSGWKRRPRTGWPHWVARPHGNSISFLPSPWSVTVIAAAHLIKWCGHKRLMV